MINNRQNGRRRGRGGQQARNGQPGGQDRGNRIDNRARGNAAQLLEKYRNLARDAQMQGDRVNTEYYLQFADHYFRVLNENRARFEEQRPRQDYRDDFGGDEDGGDMTQPQQRYQPRDDQGGDDGWDEGDTQPQAAEREPRRERFPARADEGERYERGNRNGRNEGGGGYERGRRPGNGNGANGNGGQNGYAGGNNFAAPDFLSEPVAVRPSVDLGDEAEVPAPIAADVGEEAAPKRRRAPRRPRAEEAGAGEA